MRKKILMTFAAVISFFVTIMAEPVSPQTARLAAAKFLNRKGATLKTETLHAQRRVGSSTAYETDNIYYVFNADNDQGFVVVSGDLLPPLA